MRWTHCLLCMAGLAWLGFVAGCPTDEIWDDDDAMGDDDGADDDGADDDGADDDDTGDDDDDVGDDDAGDDDSGDDDAGDDDSAPADCSLIEQANPAWEVCETGVDYCNGVFADGAGCTAYCAAAGMVCARRYGGEPGCQKEPQNVLTCGANNGHQSDWCECEFPGGDDDVGDDDACESDPGNPPYQMELDYATAVFTQRHNWVLTCYPYAYTASGAEHQDCDNQFFPDGSRTGTATFTFTNVPRGMYEAYVGGRHTENRNPQGALFLVDGHPAVINQVDPSGDYVWDYHGEYCLEGTVEVILDSSVNSGSDSVFGARLVP